VRIFGMRHHFLACHSALRLGPQGPDLDTWCAMSLDRLGPLRQSRRGLLREGEQGPNSSAIGRTTRLPT
jgi:hypothetical protein